MENDSRTPPSSLNPAKIIAASTVGSVLLFGLLPVLGVLPSPTATSQPLPHFVLVLLALGLLVLGPILSQFLYRAKDTRETSLDKTQIAFILKFAFWEASALVGLVIFLTSGDTMSSAFFAFAALTAMIFSWPR